MESAAQPREEGAEQDVGHEGHDGDVHVRGVEVVAGGREDVLVGGWGGGGGRALRARPGFVAPGEEDEEEFAEDVGGGDVEVVF